MLRVIKSSDWLSLKEADQGNVIILKRGDFDVEAYNRDEILRAHPDLEDVLKSTDKEDRIIPWTFSDERRDRDNDRILVKGWSLTDYHKNPVILFGHNQRDLPIGRSMKTFRDTHPKFGKRLRGLPRFQTREQNPFADAVYQLVRSGDIKAGSVGFQPIKAGRDPELGDNEFGLLFEKQALLEFSIVPVPSNAGALADRKDFDVLAYADGLEQMLETDTFDKALITADHLKEAIRTAKPSAPTVVVEDPPKEVKRNPGRVCSVCYANTDIDCQACGGTGEDTDDHEKIVADKLEQKKTTPAKASAGVVFQKTLDLIGSVEAKQEALEHSASVLVISQATDLARLKVARTMIDEAIARFEEPEETKAVETENADKTKTEDDSEVLFELVGDDGNAA